MIDGQVGKTMLGIFLWAFVLMIPCHTNAFTIDHSAVAHFDNLSASQLNRVRAKFNVYYGHTSHGSQLITGLSMLEVQDSEKYAFPVIFEKGGMDLGSAQWEAQTRSYLTGHPQTSWMKRSDGKMLLKPLNQKTATSKFTMLSDSPTGLAKLVK